MPDTKNSNIHTHRHTHDTPNQAYHRYLMSCTGVNCFVIHPIPFFCMPFFSPRLIFFRFRKINFVFRHIPHGCIRHTFDISYRYEVMMLILCPVAYLKQFPCKFFCSTPLTIFHSQKGFQRESRVT